jgi:hypothetical protein
MWQQVRNHVLQFALACWVLGVLALSVVVLLVLVTYCARPHVLSGYP